MTRRASEEGIGKPEQEETRGAAFGLPRPGPALTALTTSALALPGIAGSARADAPIERATSSASFSYYKEDKLSPSRFDVQPTRDVLDVPVHIRHGHRLGS